MPPHPQWLEILEEHAYLVQVLSEAAHDLGALEHSCSLLEVLREDLRVCTMQMVNIEQEIQETSAMHHDSRIESNTYHRFESTIILDKEKQNGPAEAKEQDRLMVVSTTKQTLSTEIKNLEIKAQILQRQQRHQDELQRRVVALYAPITEEEKPRSREEDEIEEDARRAQHKLYDLQKTLDHNKTLEALLRHGDHSLVIAGRHLIRGSGTSSGIDDAKKCAAQTSVVVNQARRLDPYFFEQKDAEPLKAGWLREVFQATSADNSHPNSLLQALKPHHIALLSLVSQAHKRTSEYEIAVRHAAHQFFEARARRDAVKRQVLVAWATAEAELGGEMALLNKDLENDGLARMRNITAGLDGVIPIEMAQRSSAVVSMPRSSEEWQRERQDQPVSPPSPIYISQPHTPQPSRQLLPLNLTPDLTAPLRSAPLPIPPSSPEARKHIQRGSVDMKLRRRYPPASKPPFAGPTHRRFSSDLIHQRKPIHQQVRHPVLEQQDDGRWESESDAQHDLNDLNLRPQRKDPVGIGEQDDAALQSHPQPHPGQSLLRDGQLSIPSSSMPTLPIQQTTKSVQPQSSNLSNPSADNRPRSASVQSARSGIAEPCSILPPISNSHSIRPLPQADKTLLCQSDSRDPNPTSVLPSTNAQFGRPEIQSESGSSRSSPQPTQTSVSTPQSTAILSSQRPPVHGILKHPLVPVSRSSLDLDADPWGLGVKVGVAPSSHPQPKLKSVFNLWRNNEAFKPSNPRPRTPASPELQPQPPPEEKPKHPNPRAAVQMLRFSEGVQIIPRPAVDSDPYEDEMENGLPPSPTRGSVVWSGTEEGMGEVSDDSSGDLGETTREREVSVNPASTIDPSQSSISSASSSSHLTEYSTYSPISSFSSLSGSSYIPSSHTSQDDGWTPPLDQPRTQRGDRDDSKRMAERARESRNKEYSASARLSGTETITSSQELLPTDTPSHNADNADKGRLMSYPTPNAIPNPTASYRSSRQMSQESMKSDRELLQIIFPSPTLVSMDKFTS